ncbi:MAG: SGNH/GDSL hydrolase family protein, partial [Bacteroidota bacterium]
MIVVLVGACTTRVPAHESDSETQWVATWGTAVQLVEPHNMPPEPGLEGNMLRQIVRVSLGGSRLRIRFSNEFGNGPVTLRAVRLASSEGGGRIDPITDEALLFGDEPSVTLEAGSTVISDPVAFELGPRSELAISVEFGDVPAAVTGHPGSRTTSYIVEGAASSETDWSDAVRAERWYFIERIDVEAPPSAGAVVTLGNSITDGRGSGTDRQNRWPDELARRLQRDAHTEHVAVVNMGIGGNCVLRDCLGQPALARFE